MCKATKKIKFHQWDVLWCSLFDWPESGFVRTKKYLAGHYDWRPSVHYLQPWSIKHNNLFVSFENLKRLAQLF